MKLIYLVSLIWVFAFASCGKKSEEQPKPKTITEILSKTWRISRVTINGSVDNVGNYSNYRITLSQNGSYRIVLSNSPITIVAHLGDSGTWELTDNNTFILFDKGNPTRETKTPLISPSETSFSVRFNLDDKLRSEYVVGFVPA
ncbi:MAG: hypothetical protein EAZ08_05750 [Cytophagales bacterium]|nr:MAG: hypothetical protein EAZ08_05750 [Cytophagales bacterium]